MFNSTSSLITLHSQDVVPKRAWFTLGHGQTVPGKLSSENQAAGHWEAAACPDQLNLGEEGREMRQMQNCGLVKGHGYSHIRAVTFLPIHLAEHWDVMASLHGLNILILFFCIFFFLIFI